LAAVYGIAAAQIIAARQAYHFTMLEFSGAKAANLWQPR
jgi:hypothetical protein